MKTVNEWEEPAYPSTETNVGSFNPGMSLRDYYAGQALVGIIANPYRKGTAADAAERAFEVADMMLIKRKDLK